MLPSFTTTISNSDVNVAALRCKDSRNCATCVPSLNTGTMHDNAKRERMVLIDSKLPRLTLRHGIPSLALQYFYYFILPTTAEQIKKQQRVVPDGRNWLDHPPLPGECRRVRVRQHPPKIGAGPASS